MSILALNMPQAQCQYKVRVLRVTGQRMLSGFQENEGWRWGQGAGREGRLSLEHACGNNVILFHVPSPRWAARVSP